MVLEVMGQYAGWIAVYAAVAGGGRGVDPGDSVSLKAFVPPSMNAEKNGKKFTLVVAAEGAEGGGGIRYDRHATHQSRGAPGGIGAVVAKEIEAHRQRDARDGADTQRGAVRRSWIACSARCSARRRWS